MEFQTERLLIRQLSLNDLPSYTHLHGNAKVMNMIPAPILSASEAKADLIQQIENYSKTKAKLKVWAIVEKATNQFIGTCALVFLAEGIEIGYRLDNKFWGKGYATETTEGLIDYAFAKFDESRLIAIADIRNQGSIKILRKYFTFIKEEYNEKEEGVDLIFHLDRG